MNHGEIMLKKIILDKDLNQELQKFLTKIWFDQENYIYPMYCPCGTIHKPRLEREDTLYII